MEIDLFEQVNQNGNENTDVLCSICYENMIPDNSYTINECNHTFHSKCLLDWFRRSDASSCPYCRNNIQSNNSTPNNSILFNMKIRFGKTKKAPKDFVELIKKYQNIKIKRKDIEREYKKIWNQQRQFHKNIDQDKTYKQIKQEKLDLSKKSNIAFKKRNKIRSEYFVLKNAIEHIPIRPIIIKTKKYSK